MLFFGIIWTRYYTITYRTDFFLFISRLWQTNANRKNKTKEKNSFFPPWYIMKKDKQHWKTSEYVNLNTYHLRIAYSSHTILLLSQSVALSSIWFYDTKDVKATSKALLVITTHHIRVLIFSVCCYFVEFFFIISFSFFFNNTALLLLLLLLCRVYIFFSNRASYSFSQWNEEKNN